MSVSVPAGGELEAMRRGGRRPAAIMWLLSWLALFTGCGAGDSRRDRPERIVRSDSAGVEIIVNRSPLWGAGEGWAVDPEPALQIGKAEGAEEELLHGIVSVRTAQDGILVAQQTELRLYDRAGALVRRLGSAGEGPGEFQRVADAIACGESILASERHPARLTSFDAAGEPRTVALPLPERQGLLNPLAPLLACRTGGVIGLMAGPRQPTSGPPSVRRDPGLLVSVHPVDGGVDTLLSYPGGEDFDGLRVPFGRQTLIAATDTAIYLVDTGHPELRILGTDGALRRVVRLTLAARPVTPADVEAIRSQYLYEEEGGLPAELEAQVRSRLDAVPIPETMPYFSAIRVAGDGTVWLREYQPFRKQAVTGWTAISPSGEWLGEVDFPAGLEVHEVDNGGVLGVWRDELDVEFVRSHLLRP